MFIVSWLFGTAVQKDCLQSVYTDSVRVQESLYKNYSITNQPQHYNLRLLKSHPALSDNAFSPMDPFEAIALLAGDLSSYKTPCSQKAQEKLYECQSMLIRALTAKRLAKAYNNKSFYQFYYELVAEKIKSLTIGDSLLLLGGSQRHALLFSVKSLSDSFLQIKLFNSGRKVSTYHHQAGSCHYQTYLMTLEKERLVKLPLLKKLFCSLFFSYSLAEIYKKIALISASEHSCDTRLFHKRQAHDHTCLRTAFCYWLKEEALQEEYPAFKRTFSQKAYDDCPQHPNHRLAKCVLEKRL